MSQPDYPKFSKRLHREHREQREQRYTRGGYNFEKTKEYSLAEKWFEERKAHNREPTSVPSPAKLPSPKALFVKKAPPGLVREQQQEQLQKNAVEAPQKPKRQRLDSCDLDLKFPSYNDFNYVDPDEIVIVPQMNFDLSNIYGEAHFAPQEQYSTPPIIEDNLSEYEGHTTEFESQEALQTSLALQEMQNQLIAYQLYNLLVLMSNNTTM